MKLCNETLLLYLKYGKAMCFVEKNLMVNWLFQGNLYGNKSRPSLMAEWLVSLAIKIVIKFHKKLLYSHCI